MDDPLTSLFCPETSVKEANKFDNVNTYSDKKTKREKKIYVFPYKQIESNKNYTLYRKTMC